jgi:hypothetical protein
MTAFELRAGLVVLAAVPVVLSARLVSALGPVAVTRRRAGFPPPGE